MSCEVMVVSAHPDDAELACSGTIKKLTNAGHRVVMIDCTRGEMGTRGTPELRHKEAMQAAEILGVTDREILTMPDGRVEHTQQNINALIEVVREYRPRIVVTTPPVERHPDHEAVHRLVRSAVFLSGLQKIETQRNGVNQPTFRPAKTMCFMQQLDLPRTPDVYVDITDTFEAKMSSIRAYGSQFHVPENYTSTEQQTYLSRPEFLEELTARALFHGTRIGVRYAEAFYSVESVGVRSLADII